VNEILCTLLTVFMVVLVLRAVLSWFPLEPGGMAAQLGSVVFRLTEWALAPLRRVIPPAGMFDLSFMVLFFLIILARQALC
jgi:YggT family protein